MILIIKLIFFSVNSINFALIFIYHFQCITFSKVFKKKPFYLIKNLKSLYFKYKVWSCSICWLNIVCIIQFCMILKFLCKCNLLLFKRFSYLSKLRKKFSYKSTLISMKKIIYFIKCKILHCWKLLAFVFYSL